MVLPGFAEMLHSGIGTYPYTSCRIAEQARGIGRERVIIAFYFISHFPSFEFFLNTYELPSAREPNHTSALL